MSFLRKPYDAARGLFNAIGSPSRWFGVDPSVRWPTTDERDSAYRNALFNAGAGMTMAAGTSTVDQPVSSLAAIARGLQIGRETWQEGQAEARQRQQRADAYAPLTNGMEGLSRADLLRMFVRASQMGDSDTMRAVSEMLKSGVTGQSYRFIDTDRGLFVGNEETGDVRPADVAGTPVGTVRGRQLRQFMGPEGPQYGWFNPDGTVDPVNGVRPALSRTEAQSKAYAFLAMLEPLEQEGRLNALTPRQIPGIVQNVLASSNSPAAYFAQLASLPPETRLILNDAALYAEAFLRITTGAAYNMNEFRNAVRQFTPLPGDDARVLQQKRNRRSNLMRVLGILGAPGGMTTENANDIVDPDAFRQVVGADERDAVPGRGRRGAVLPDRDANGNVIFR